MKTSIEAKKRFLLLQRDDEEILKELQDLVGDNLGQLVEAFCRHLSRFDVTRSLMEGDQMRRRIEELQKDYLLSLFAGPYDDSYFSSRRRIGKAHSRLQLGPEYYLGSYALYSTLIYPLIIEKYAGEPEKLQKALVAVVKIFNLDAQIAMETYIESYLQRLELINRELERMNSQLEGTVEERSRELRLYEEKLRHIERLVLIGTLASGIAHEVGTPLSIISGRVEMLAERAQEDPLVGKDLAIINQQIERITKIIRELLNVARQKPNQFSFVDLRKLFSDLLEFLKIPLEKAGIRVNVSIPDDAAGITGDPDQLQQLFMNLMVNAVQAMPEPGVLTIRLSHRRRGNADFVLIEISDTGVGIPKELLDRIFDPFFSTKSRGQGTGLGLSIARGIVNKHGGEIEVKSRQGEGSTFSIWLPEAQPE